MAGESRSSTHVAAAVVASALFVGACAAKVSARGAASSSAASAEGTTEHVWNGGEPPPRVASPAPAPSTVTATSAGGGASVCPLTCLVPHKGRISPAEETRLAEALAPTMEEIRACVHGRPSLTLRFDSASSLTHFGIASDDDSPCLASLRERHPPITMAGPLTLRCTERCRR